MRSFTTRLVACAALLLGAALGTPDSLPAQDWTGLARVAGTVFGPDGAPFEGARVTVFRGSEGHGPEPVITNQKGRWGFLGLGSGQWTIRIEAAGYQSAERVVPLQQAGAPLDAVEIALKKLEDVPQAKEVLRVRDELERGNQLLRDGKVEEGRGVLESLLPELEPPSRVPVLVAIARTMADQNAIAAAIARLDEALALAPDDVAALQLMSSILVIEGRAAEAQAYLSRLPADQQKLDPNALLNQGIAAYNEGQLDQALAFFDQAVRENPEFPDAYYYRGLVHLGKASNAAARADFARLIELAPAHTNATEAKQFLAYLESQ